jgi:hypothetical protein
MEFYTSRVFLRLTDHTNLVSKCQVRVIVGLKSPTGLGKYRKIFIILVEVLHMHMFGF